MKTPAIQKAILAILHRQSNMPIGWATGLEIKTLLKAEGFWFVEGRTYPHLRALEQLGFIESWESTELKPERGMLPYRCYRVTKFAREAK